MPNRVFIELSAGPAADAADGRNWAGGTLSVDTCEIRGTDAGTGPVNVHVNEAVSFASEGEIYAFEVP